MANKAILVIDGNPKTSRRLSEYVNDAGMDCISAGSFEAARDQASKLEFIGIFADLHANKNKKDKMGLDFARHIKYGSGPNKNTPIVILVERCINLSSEELKEIFREPIQARLLKEQAGIRRPAVEQALRDMIKGVD